MTIERPETIKDLIELGTHVAVALGNSARTRSAAADFAKWQAEGQLHESVPDKQKGGREMSVELPYSLESIVADITQRIERLERH